MARASEDKLADLHDKVATVMGNALDRSEERVGKILYNEDGSEVEVGQEINPALFSAITKFLKDNEITAQIGTNSNTDKLAEKLKNRRKVGNVVHLKEQEA